MKRRLAERLLETKDGNTALASHVFHREGHPIVDYKDSWFKACKAAGFTYMELNRRAGEPKEQVSRSSNVARFNGSRFDLILIDGQERLRDARAIKHAIPHARVI